MGRRALVPTQASGRGMAGMLVIAITAGFAGVAWKWRNAEAALARATSAEQRAQNNLQAADQAVDDFLITVANDTLLEQPNMEHLRTNLLAMGSEYYEQLAAENDDDPNVVIRAAV